jgi:ADP-heptose:LPS heptosyltransferase
MEIIKPSRVLIIQFRRIGDVLLTTPVIRAIKKACPEVRLCFLTELESRSLLENNPNLDNLIVWEGKKRNNPIYFAKRILELRRNRFDTVIDLQGSGPSCLVSVLCGAKCRIGFNYRFRKLLYSPVVERDSRAKYGAAFKMDILAPLGISSTELSPAVVISAESKKWAEQSLLKYHLSGQDFKVALSAVSRRSYKRWPLEYYAELCRLLANNSNLGPRRKIDGRRLSPLSRLKRNNIRADKFSVGGCCLIRTM